MIAKCRPGTAEHRGPVRGQIDDAVDVFEQFAVVAGAQDRPMPPRQQPDNGIAPVAVEIVGRFVEE